MRQSISNPMPQLPTPALPEPAPFLKWVGGKRQLLPELFKTMTGFHSKGHYYEPFIGGGALFFAMRTTGWRGRATLGDSNELLIRTYMGVRNDVEAVIECLANYAYDEKEYYEDRARHNLVERWDDQEAAAWFIYINKAGYNGLWRVNSKGQCNVPFGRYTNPTICDPPRLRAAAKALHGTKLMSQDFEKTVKSAEKGDLVYFDCPYVPVSTTADFTSYTRDGFTFDDQVRLRDCALALKARGVHVILSNADVPKVRELYGKQKPYGGVPFHIRSVSARRNVNSDASKRGKVGEVIIT